MDQFSTAIIGCGLATSSYGCRVLQKALEHISKSQLAVMLKHFEGVELKLIYDQNGNHVIQKCIEIVCKTALKDEEPQVRC